MKLRILTYNIQHGSNLDNGFNFELFRNVFDRIDADIICLQEVDRFTERVHNMDLVHLFESMTHYTSYFSKALDFDGGQYGNLILSRYPILEAYTLPLIHPDQIEDRCAQILTIKCPNDFMIQITNTHLDNHESNEIRYRQIHHILSQISSTTFPVFLSGDLNLEPDELNEEMPDSWQISEVKHIATFPSYMPTKKIDYVFYRKHPLITYINSHVFDETNASDHLPLFSDFDIL